jgi:hypothetical protein
MAADEDRRRATEVQEPSGKNRAGERSSHPDPLRDNLKAVAGPLRNASAIAGNPEETERTTLLHRKPAGATLHEALRAAEAALIPGLPNNAGDPTLAHRGKPQATPAKTQLVRGAQHPKRTDFHQDPVVAWLVVIGGPGLGAYRAVFEGNNTIGRSSGQRIPIDFGDESISAEEQAYLRYDSTDRQFLLVPNLAKTNVISVNEMKPTSAVKLAAMDVITMGRTQLVFVPFCGEDFDWSELADLKE